MKKVSIWLKKNFINYNFSMKEIKTTKEKIDMFVKKIDQNKIFNLNIEHFAKKCRVSKASISRYVKSRGFENYKSFILFVNNGVFEKSVSETFQRNKVDNSFKIAELSTDVNSSKRVLVVGFGSSKQATESLFIGLAQVGVPTIFINQFQDLIFLLPTLTKNDTVICFSEHAKNREIKFVLNELRHHNSKNWLIGSNNEYEEVKNIPLNNDQNEILRVDGSVSRNNQLSFVAKFVLFFINKYKLVDYKIAGSALLDLWNNK